MSGSSDATDMSTGWSVWKDIAYPGRVHVPGEDGRVNVYDFTSRDMHLLERSGNAKVADAWNIPVCWEHQDVGPDRAQLSQNPARDMALGVFGRIKRFARTPDGRLKALLTGSNPKDYAQLLQVGFVSPEIQWDWVDTDGRTWRGPSVTHLAATPRPVQRHQHPVGTDPDAPPPGVRANSLEKLVRMSLSKNPGGARVGARLRLSLDHYGGARPMPDTDTTAADPKKLSPWEKIAAALSAHCGIQLGDVSTINTPDEFARIVEVAAMNFKAGSEPAVPDIDDDLPPEGDDDNAPPEGDLDAPPEGASDAPNPPVQMSLQNQNKALTARLLAGERNKLVARAEKVQRSGALRPADADALVAECRTVRLSLTNDGALKRNDTITKLEMIEKVKPGAAVNLGGAKGQKKMRASLPANAKPAPKSDYEEDPELDADAVVDAFFNT